MTANEHLCKVFGIVEEYSEHDRVYLGSWGNYGCSRCGQKAPYLNGPLTGKCPGPPLPDLSSDPMRVIEGMRQNGWGGELCFDPSNNIVTERSFFARFGESGQSHAKTLAEAVFAAACQATGWEGEGS